MWARRHVAQKASEARWHVRTQGTLPRVFSCEICEVFKNTYFEEHLLTSAYEFIGDITLFHETILKKQTDGKTDFQDGKKYNWKQHFEW